MGPWGAIIMSFFGAVFFGMALGRHGPLAIAPAVAVFAAIASYAIALLRGGAAADPSERAGRVIMWSSIAEGIGIFVIANLLVNLGRPDLVLPGIATIVGLHFLPIAYAIPFPSFYALAAALLVAAAAGFALGGLRGGEIAGLAAAGALWTASAAALRRTQRGGG